VSPINADVGAMTCVRRCPLWTRLCCNLQAARACGVNPKRL